MKRHMGAYADATLEGSRRGRMCRKMLHMLLVFVLVSAGALPTVNAHECQHAKVAKMTSELLGSRANAEIVLANLESPSTEAALGRRSLSQAQVPPTAIRVHTEYVLQGTPLSAEQQRFLQEEVVPTAIKVIQQSVWVRRPVVGNLQLPRTCIAFSPATGDCFDWQPKETAQASQRRAVNLLGQDADFPLFNLSHFGPYNECDLNTRRCRDFTGGPGVPDTDLIVYVAADANVGGGACGAGSSTVAFASALLQDQATGRPVAGFVNVCPNMVPQTNGDPWEELVPALIHEMLHVLAMSPALFPRFVDEFGRRLPDGAVTRTAADGTTEVILEPVVAHARDHFDCSSINGVPLEDDGGSGTAGSHWEARWMLGEIMDAYATKAGGSTALSGFTLKLLEGSGWYFTNTERAQLLQWGRNATCTFVEQSCTEFTTDHPDNVFLCTPDQVAASNAGEFLCGLDGANIAYCKPEDKMGSDCYSRTPLGNGQCTSTNVPFSDSVIPTFGMVVGVPTSRCSEQLTGRTSRRTGSVVRTLRGPLCFNYTCIDDNPSLILAGQDPVQCRPRAGASGLFVDLSDEFDNMGFQEGIIECPAREEICEDLRCPNACSGNGECFSGTCRCHLGYLGEDCALRIACTAANSQNDSSTCMAEALPPLPPAPALSSPDSGSPGGSLNVPFLDDNGGGLSTSTLVIIGASFGGAVLLLLCAIIIRRCCMGRGRRKPEGSAYRQEQVEQQQQQQQQQPPPDMFMNFPMHPGPPGSSPRRGA